MYVFSTFFGLGFDRTRLSGIRWASQSRDRLVGLYVAPNFSATNMSDEFLDTPLKTFRFHRNLRKQPSHFGFRYLQPVFARPLDGCVGLTLMDGSVWSSPPVHATG